MKAGGWLGTVKNVAPDGLPWTMLRRRGELDKWTVWVGLISRVDWLTEHSGMLGRSC